MISNPKDISNVYNILVTPNFNNGIDNVIYEIQLKFYWKINKDLNPPLYMDIVNCFDKNICGNASINKDSFNIKFEYGKEYFTNNIPGTYNIWTVCFTDIPNPSKPSSVVSIWEFIILPKILRYLEDNKFDSIDFNKKINNNNQSNNVHVNINNNIISEINEEFLMSDENKSDKKIFENKKLKIENYRNHLGVEEIEIINKRNNFDIFIDKN